MTDTLSSLPDFLGADADEELMFEDADAAAVSVATDANLDPAPAELNKPRRGRRKGQKSAEAVESAASCETQPPASEHETLSAETPLQGSVEEPAEIAPASFPSHRADPAGSALKPWLIGLVALATFSSCASLSGLLMVSRTLARANADRDQAAMQQQAFARIPDLVAKLNIAASRMDAASARLSSLAPSGPPATQSDLHHELDLLKVALAQHQPDGVSALGSNVRGGFEDIATRLDRVQAQIEGMAHSKPSLQAASLPSASPPARHRE